MIIPLRENEPISWWVRTCVARAVAAGAVGEATESVQVYLSPSDWTTLDMETAGDCRRWFDVAQLKRTEMGIELVSAARYVHVNCSPRQANGALDLVLTAELSPEVFA